MGLKTILWKTINSGLGSLGYELINLPVAGTGFTMEDGLARLRQRGLKIQTIIDIGASDGRWTKRALQFFPEANGLLVEPLEERRSALEEVRRQHPKVDFAIAAAGNREGEVAFHVAADLVGSGVTEVASPETRSVRLTTLDKLAQERNLQPPYLLKLDTHGFEVPIFEGASETLQSTSMIIMEVYNFQLTSMCLRFHEMCAYLEKLGFRCCDIADLCSRPKDGAFWQMDLFFAPKDAPIFGSSSYL